MFPKWLLFALLSTFWWGIWGFLVKAGSDRIDPYQMQILFVAGMAPPAVAALLRLRFRVEGDLRGVSYGVLNGVLATLGMVAFYAAMAKGKASVVGPMTALFPLFTIAGAMLLLKERISKVQAVGVLFALAAIFVFAL